MQITRRKFLKYLAWAVPAVAIAPAAVVKAAAGIAEKPDLWGCYPIEWITIDEARARYKPGIHTMLDNNPLFSGSLGEYNGVTIHRHK
jgi:hypothetical protein